MENCEKTEMCENETEMARTGREKDIERCSNEKMEDGNERTPKDRETETEVKRCEYKKVHEGDSSKERLKN